MAIIKHPYELSVWKEELNRDGTKNEVKGVIIGAHDMSFLGKATNLVLTRKFNGTNTLTFQMPDKYFDAEKGDFIHNELIDMLYTESKLKLFYKDRWYEFFIKKTDEKKQFKSYMVQFTCSDAFIDELSRNGYGITFDTELYNNVEEIGSFTDVTLKDSIWQYYPENNWGDFTEYKEEKLYRISVNQFKYLKGYKLDFLLDNDQLANCSTDKITNLFTGDERPVELSDDIAREQFWDQKSGDKVINQLTKTPIEDIPNDGYIYVPYSCLSFCYGSEQGPDQTKTIKYDRAATETALTVNDKLVIAPQSVDPRTIIQFYAFPKDAILELDDAGVILDKDFSYFVRVPEWNDMIGNGNGWYIFEDTRLVEAEVLGAIDDQAPSISHTFRYLKNAEIIQEGLGNKYVFYDGYLSDINGNNIVKGKKFSITDRSEINISEEIDQYVTVYNANASDFKNEYISSNWIFNENTDSAYRVCSKIDTRQVIPQLARNLVQNGIDMDSTDGWAPMNYMIDKPTLTAPSVSIRGIIENENDESIKTTALQFSPAVEKVASKVTVTALNPYPGEGIARLSFDCGRAFKGENLPSDEEGIIYWHHLTEYGSAPAFEGLRNYNKSIDEDIIQESGIIYNHGDTPNYKETPLYTVITTMVNAARNNTPIYLIDGKYYSRIKKQVEKKNDEYILPDTQEKFEKWLKEAGAKAIFKPSGSDNLQQLWTIYSELLKETEKVELLNSLAEPVYTFLFTKEDWVWAGLKKFYRLSTTRDSVQTEEADNNGEIFYLIKDGNWLENTFFKEIKYVPGVAYYSGGIYYRLPYEITVEYTNIPNSIFITSEGKTIINFGIIGQEQTIQKDKIYCLGVAGYTLDENTNVTIQIGKGTLISEGNYQLVDDKILTFNQLKLDAPKKGEEFDVDLKDNIKIAIPKTKFLLFKSNFDIENPYFVIQSQRTTLLFKLYLFEAYTKGKDCFPDTKEDHRLYRYSGRDLFWNPNGFEENNAYTYKIKNIETNTSYSETEMRQQIIFEDDIMLGATYGYQRYFIQRLITQKQKESSKSFDTMGEKSYLSSNEQEFIENSLPLDAANYTEDDYEIQTNYIDLNNCEYYNHDAGIDECDCNYQGEDHICFYQKFGYCPYRFKTEKHPRRVRTLSVNKSNRFNIIQSISKVFEVYPQFYIDHKDNGTVKMDNQDNYIKKVFYITEKGTENKIGFRYEKNLKDISRTISSEQIVTKLYVLDVDSELSKTGLCSIKTAEDNPSKDSYLIDLSYYITKGMLDGDEVEQDLYGVTPGEAIIKDSKTIPSGFLYQLGYYNTEYDKIANKIINLQDASFTELEANVTVNFEGILAAQEQILKIKKQIKKYQSMYEPGSTTYQNQSIYKNYLTKLSEQESILVQLIYTTFFTQNKFNTYEKVWDHNCFHSWDNIDDPDIGAMEFFDHITDFDECKNYWFTQHMYTGYGILGQYNREYQQIQQWKLEMASYLKLINQISNAFYLKYEPYLKEGTWSDSNYLTDNAYYFGALDVAAEGAIPKVSYNISVVDISTQGKDYDEVYNFDLCDVTYVEDIGMFGVNPKTGFPNRLKVLISEIAETLDDESKNSIKVQNFTTQFDDLFQQVTATVQSLTFNENIYKRSSNFTALQNISNRSLQGALDTNDLTLLDTQENNIQVDNTGTRGSDINNHANKYKLDGQGLFFSNDGGQHWSVGVGPSGINADYIKVGTLDAGKIRIADSNYIYFSWDKDGIISYRDPQGINTTDQNVNDAAIFNKYGLSIVNNGNIRLRAGYSYNGTSSNTSSEQTQGEQIGFFLYNNDGIPIFSALNSEDDKNSARIILAGEIFASDGAGAGVITEITKDYFTAVYNNVVQKDNIKTIQQVDQSLTISEIDSPSEQVEYVYSQTDKKMYYKSKYKTIVITTTGSILIYTDEKITQVPTTISKYDKEISTSPFYFYTSASTPLSTLISIDGTYQTISIFEVSQNSSPASAYIYNGKYYSNIESKTTSISNQSSGTVGVFINNRTLASDNSVATSDKYDKRAFAIIKDDGNNVFTILRNGSLYIGGEVKDYSHLDELNDYIEISNPKITMTKDGDVRMDFGRFTDMQGKSLMEVIRESISSAFGSISIPSHSHSFSFTKIERASNISGWNDSDQAKMQILSNALINIGMRIDEVDLGISYSETW